MLGGFSSGTQCTSTTTLGFQSGGGVGETGRGAEGGGLSAGASRAPARGLWTWRASARSVWALARSTHLKKNEQFFRSTPFSHGAVRMRAPQARALLPAVRHGRPPGAGANSPRGGVRRPRCSYVQNSWNLHTSLHRLFYTPTLWGPRTRIDRRIDRTLYKKHKPKRASSRRASGVRQTLPRWPPRRRRAERPRRARAQ